MNHEPSNENLFVANALEASLRIGVVALLVVWIFSIVKPFIIPVVWGIIIAIALFPVYSKLQAALGGRRGVAAILVTLVLLLILIVPTVMLSNALIESSLALSERISDGSLAIPPPGEQVRTWPLIGEPTERFWRLASGNLAQALDQVRPQLIAFSRWLLGVAAGAGFGILQFIFAIIIAGILMAHSAGGHRSARSIATRLAGARGEGFVKLSEATVRGVATGILGVAIIQSILAGLGFLTVGVPGAGVWTLIVLILCIIQVGPALVLLPVVIYVFSTADTTTAVLFMIWSIFVGVLDNVLKPLLMGRGVDVPVLVIFIGAIGGFLSMGIIGLFVGSVVLVLGYQIFRGWLRQDGEPARTVDAKSAAEAKGS